MHESSEQAHVEGSKRGFMFVWVWLLGLTGGGGGLGFQDLPLKGMLALLMTLSIIKASLIISYFMHLRYERRSLALTLMPALVFVIAMMFVVFPDSIRLYLMKPK